MKTKEIPFSKGYPVIGNLLSYKANRLKMLADHRDQYGDIFKIKVANRILTVINKPEYVKHVMQTNFNNYIKKINFDRVFGQGIFTANGETWKKQRELIRPLFNAKYLETCLEPISQTTHTYLDDYLNQQGDIRDFYAKVTFDVIVKNIIGLEFEESYRMFSDFCIILTEYLANDNYQLIPLPSFLNSKKKRFDEATKEVNDLVYKSIEKAKSEEDGTSFVHAMLKATRSVPGLKVDDELIRDNIVTMLFAGYETSALTLSWLSYELCRNPDWMKKCKVEAKRFDLNSIKLNDLNELPEIDACINEAMRLYPVGWAFTRNSINEDVIDGYHIKKDETILISSFLTHRDPSLWSDADKFDPSRFQGKKYDRFQFFPFGTGPRTCMGMSMGMAEMKVIILSLLKDHHFEISGAHPKMDARSTLCSSNGFNIHIKPD